ncbi:MAG: NAD(P)-dependent oxidoreductase [Verrucomicrobiales bacterium]|nr:NAD(P)-dependent oxidoreductase [Verrucomicrobiales bacterium]
MKRALVTGASGFLGAALVERLVHAGVDVLILHRPGADLWRLRSVQGRCRPIVADLRQPGSYRDALIQARPDTVFHLAWTGVGSRHRDEWVQIEGNLHATLALVMEAADAGCRHFIGAGSQAEYGPQNRILDEQAPTRPSTLYGAAKLSAYHLSSRIAAHRGMRFAWLRVFSTYGPKDNPGWMLPTLIQTLLRRERPTLTAGEQRWDYLHVADAVEAFYRVGVTPDATDLFNLGSGEARPLRQVIELIRDRIDPSLPLGFGEVPYRPDQVMWLQADTRRLQSVASWQVSRTLEEGLADTVAWHQSQRP